MSDLGIREMGEALESRIAAKIRPMQIIVAAMALGCIFLGVVMMVIPSMNEDGPPEVPLISYIALLFVGGALVMRIIISMVLTNQGRTTVVQESANLSPEEVADRFIGLYQTQLIITSALLEGPAFFLLIAFMVEGWIVCPIVAGVLVIGILTGFPTVSRVSGWIQDQIQIIEQRQLLR